MRAVLKEAAGTATDDRDAYMPTLSLLVGMTHSLAQFQTLHAGSDCLKY